jgi:hypothetical protein
LPIQRWQRFSRDARFQIPQSIAASDFVASNRRQRSHKPLQLFIVARTANPNERLLFRYVDSASQPQRRKRFRIR